jgi:RimJ/RimL family protein N-acetyltransferase
MLVLRKLFSKKPGNSLTGNRMILSPLKNGNFKKIRMWLSDLELAKYAFGLLADEEVLNSITQNYMRGIESGIEHILGINTTDGEFIGFIRYHFKEEGIVNRLGILIGERDYWDKGYGTEALFLLLKHLFLEHGVNRVELDTAEFNKRAQKCFKKVGFRKKGEFTNVDFSNKSFQHKIFMSITRQDFLTLNS